MEGITRTRAAKLGTETLTILKQGGYQNDEGRLVEIGELVQQAAADTGSYPPDKRLPDTHFGENQTRFDVANESTLAAARKLVDEGHRPVALNFASAKHPGGGFLSGARAQEESLARSSGLYACLDGHPMYELHQASRDPMYTSYAIYSPDVPVFRDDDGALLPKPYLCSFITAPAANAKVVLERNRSRRPEIREVMWERILRVLAIAAQHEHEALVLGAWGCGVFGNDTVEIAWLFEQALTDRFTGAFSRVVFAVLDGSPEERFIGPFKKAFARFIRASNEP